LAARLVASAGDRTAIKRRIQELLELHKQAVIERQASEEALTRLRAYDFIDDIFADCIRDPARRDFDSLYRQHLPSLLAQQLKPHYDQFIERVELVEEILAKEFPERLPETWYEVERRQLIAQFSDPLDRKIAREHLNTLEKEYQYRRSSPISRALTLHVPIGIPSPEITAARMQLDGSKIRDAVQRELTAKATEESIGAQLVHAQQALAERGVTEGLLPAMLAVCGIALAGIVLPLLWMTFGTVGLPKAGRGVFTTLFILSLTWFVLYLAWEIRRLEQS